MNHGGSEPNVMQIKQQVSLITTLISHRICVIMCSGLMTSPQQISRDKRIKMWAELNIFGWALLYLGFPPQTSAPSSHQCLYVTEEKPSRSTSIAVPRGQALI